MGDDFSQDGFQAGALNSGQANDLYYVDLANLTDWSTPRQDSTQEDLAISDIFMQESHEAWDANVFDCNLLPTADSNDQGDELGGIESLVQLRKDSAHEIFQDHVHNTASILTQQLSQHDENFACLSWESDNTRNEHHNSTKSTREPFTDSNSHLDSGFLSDELNLASFDQETFLDGLGVTALGRGNTDSITIPEKDYRAPPKNSLYTLRSDHGSTQSVSSSIASRAWRESWGGLSRTLKMIGACWRCKILRKKCDPEEPCKACPKSENKSRWQSIGCRRGTLLYHSPEISLCPKATDSAESQVAQEMETTRSLPEATPAQQARLLLQDTAVRLEQVIYSVEDTYNKVVLDILCSPVVDLASIQCREHDLQSNILTIVWGLVDNPSVKVVLGVKDVSHVVEVMKAAAIYEIEYGHSTASSLAIECLRNCIDILRLYGSGFLTPTLHADCHIHECEVESFRLLNSNFRPFLEELSTVIFRKENRPADRKWWLSAFYALYLQSFVRRVIMLLEKLSLANLSASSRALHQDFSTYLHLAIELFEAASASYDPLMSTWSLDKEPSESKLDLRLIKYYRIAQQALNTAQWPQGNTHSSVEFLNGLYYDGPPVNSAGLNNQAIFPALTIELTQQRLSINTQPSRNHTASDVIYENSIHDSLTNNDAPLFSKFKGRSSGPLRAKRRATSPPQDNSPLQRNDSSSSMLNVLNTRSRVLSGASQSSPMSSTFSFAYDTSSSPQWNESEESLAGIGQLLRNDSPAILGLFKRGTTSLHTKSSNESFLEMPRILNKHQSHGAISRDALSCECCPAKPKKFDSVDALRAHEAKRQYECHYCGNRFKTKNEAERHQESLHIRRRAWSCLVLYNLGFDHAFHDSPEEPGHKSICGYCGIEISISRDSTDFDSMYPQKQHENLLLEHLQEVHKVGQCNMSKKFYRADHFRQHLKHSHGAIPGKWVNVLETKCMHEGAGSLLEE
ncbi:hypothetical protein F5X99DRAFT_84001 [Biscogniauxia marginata]|nr:hypothetical protein F5X99DRAFT_84001 [Biscogniauxia marginata]